MPGLFSRLKGRDAVKSKGRKAGEPDPSADQLLLGKRWDDAWTRHSIEPYEVQDLIVRGTDELKARALDRPFFLLPFRPTSDPSAVRSFVRHFFDHHDAMHGEALAQELRMAEPMVLAGVIKWCWSRLPGGVVGWDAYELFKIGESDSSMARDSFNTFIPLSVENAARAAIVTSFFDLLSAIAAHGKRNGFGGRKLSRMAAWWAFEHKDNGDGFEGSYKAWLTAADATSHLFFAYLRSLAPAPHIGGISLLPMSLQKLLEETEYPPQTPLLMQASTYKVVMIVDNVSPGPFALLRRGNHFQYRPNDKPLQEFSEYEDPVQALTEECHRVLKAIASANETEAVSSSEHSTGLRDTSWSRFQDIGFSSPVVDKPADTQSLVVSKRQQGLRTTPARGGTDDSGGRPTTPSWADFLSTGFSIDDPNGPSHMLLPPDKVLPPINTNLRQSSSQSHQPRLQSEQGLEPGELASINTFDLDESFWWVWMSSLAPEETAERKSAFGRCAVIETIIKSGRWLVWEEVVKGAKAEPADGTYIAEKKGFFSWTKRSKISRSKSTRQPSGEKGQLKANSSTGLTRPSSDKQAQIHRAAQQLSARNEQESLAGQQRRGRTDADATAKTTSTLTLQPAIMSEASPAMKWASRYDKETIRGAYLSNSTTGRGTPQQSTADLHSVANGSSLALPEKNDAASITPNVSNTNLAMPTPPKDGKQDQLKPQPQPQPSAPGRDSPLPPTPPKEKETNPEVLRGLAGSPEPDAGVQNKRQHKKLHKEKERETKDKEKKEKETEAKEKKEKMIKEKEEKEKEKEAEKDKDKATGGGFKKLFGRRNRSSKVPDDAANQVNGMMAKDANAAGKPGSAGQPKSAQKNSMDEPAYPTKGEKAAERANLSRVGTADEVEAQDEFSRFDQGPLVEQPAFVPEAGGAEDDEEDAVPPPIARKRVPKSSAPEKDEEADADADEAAPAPEVPTTSDVPAEPDVVSPIEPEPEESEERRSKEVAANRSSARTSLDRPSDATPAQPPALERWAQIRKSANERAAQRATEQAPASPPPARPAIDTGANSEETIESRVARIKARVAELTNNMEGPQAPGSNNQSPVRK